MNLRRWLVTVLVGTAVVAVGTGVAFANNAWENFHWPTNSRDLTVGVGPTSIGGSTATLAPFYDLGTEVFDWNRAADGTDLFLTFNETGTNDIEVGEFTDPCCYGIARIFIDGDHILQGEVAINTLAIEEDFGTGTLRTEVGEHVLCQEIGHTIGLDHQHGRGPKAQSCMNAGFGTIGDYPDWNSHDAKMLADIYAHDDTAGGGGDGGGNGGGNGGGKDPCEKKNPPPWAQCPSGQADGEWVTVHIWPRPGH